MLPAVNVLPLKGLRHVGDAAARTGISKDEFFLLYSFAPSEDSPDSFLMLMENWKPFTDNIGIPPRPHLVAGQGKLNACCLRPALNL